MEPALRAAVEAVHASPVRAVLHVSGGAAQSMGWIMSVPGASRTLIEARVPYQRESMMDVLGGGGSLSFAIFLNPSFTHGGCIVAFARVDKALLFNY